MKFLHCADLHLGSALSANLDGEKRKKRKNELTEVFVRIAEYAANQGVRAVLIAGDLFEEEDTSSVIVRMVYDTVRRYPEIDFLYLRGNHDAGPGTEDAGERPENLKVFGREWTYYEYGDITVAGIEPGAETVDWYADLQLKPDRTNLVLLHGQVVNARLQEAGELICLPQLQNKNIDYLALGHLHSYRAEALDARGLYCYCGCPEGRGFDECGEKGIVCLDLSEGSVKHTFLPFAKRTIHELSVDITSTETTVEVEERIAAAVSPMGPEDMVRVGLCGSVSVNAERNLAYLKERFQNRFFAFSISDRAVRTLLDPKDYENDVSLCGEFIRLVMASEYTEEEKEIVLRLGLRALSGEEVDTCF